MALQQRSARVTRWTGGQHPTLAAITLQMQDEGLRPYCWTNPPNYRYPVRSHGHNKVLYVLQGTIEVQFPDYNQTVRMCAGDRLDIPRGIRHAIFVGKAGTKCVEAAFRG